MSTPARRQRCGSSLRDDPVAEQESRLKDAAVNGLRDLGRLPNREIALGTADVVQRRLNVDLGIGLGAAAGGLPPTNSRQATDIIRRLIAWATQGDEDMEESGAPRPGSRWSV